MRDITFKQDIDPDTFAPTLNLYVGEQYAGVTLFIEAMQDATARSASLIDELASGLRDAIDEEVPVSIPDITPDEMAEIYKLVGGKLNRNL